MSQADYELHLFNISSRDEYLAYSRQSLGEASRHGHRIHGGDELSS